MRNSQGDIDAFINEVHGPVEHIELRRHRRIGIEKGIQDWTQHLFATENRRRQAKSATRGRSLARREDFGLLKVTFRAKRALIRATDQPG